MLVEAPPSAGVRTRADQRAAGARPYCILIRPQRVLGWQHGPDGKLSQLRLTWSRTEPGDFGAKTIPQIRVYDAKPGQAVTVRDFESREVAGKTAEWVQVAESALDMTSIPLATFYTGKTAPMCAEPPLRELAYLNAKHWALQASADALLQVASVPLLAAIGVDPETTIAVGSNAAVNLPVGADMKYVEHSGKAIGVGANQIKELEAQMKATGARLIEQTAGTKTATQAGEDAANANSTLAGWVQDFRDSMAALLDIIASYRGDEKGGTVTIHADLDPDTVPTETMQVLAKMQMQGALSRSRLFAEAQRRGLVSSEATWEEEQELITLEGGSAEPQPGMTDA